MVSRRVSEQDRARDFSVALGRVDNWLLGSRKWRYWLRRPLPVPLKKALAAGCEHRSAVYYAYMSSGAQKNCHLQAAKSQLSTRPNP